MVAMTSSASERLALLSNTAMLKNVLEKDQGILERHESIEKPQLSHYDDTAPISTIQDPPISPGSRFSNQDRDTFSPHVATDIRRDSPPRSFSRSDHKHHYQSHAQNRRFGGHSDYPPFPPLSRGPYMQNQPPSDQFFRENHTTMILAPLAPQPDTRARMPVDVVLGSSYRSPYEDRRGVPVHSSTGRPPSDPCGRSMNYFSPPLISVSDDCEDTSERQQQHLPSHGPSYQTLLRDNYVMRDQLHEKDNEITSLLQRVCQLETQISELRQLPTGKISHIPIDDMLRIMHEYGSELSNQTIPKRRDDIKKASIVRQFRRWNPEFFHWFIHVNGEWVPKLGKEGELKRRVDKRLEVKRQSCGRKSVSSSGSYTM